MPSNFTAMKETLIFLFAVSIAFTIQSCNPAKNIVKNPTGSSDVLYQYKWYVAELNGKPYTFSRMDKNPAWIQITNGSPAKVAGNTGCNNLMGTVETAKGSSLKFSPLATTKMACPGNTEAGLLTALASVSNYSIADTQLVLKNGNTVLAKLNGVSIETDKLRGTWVLNYISGPRITFEGLYPGKKPLISFNFAERIIMGNNSCNGFSAKYVMSGDTIHFADGLQTMMHCEGVGEETFMNMLKKVNRFVHTDSTLTFLTDDVAVMRFGRK